MAQTKIRIPATLNRDIENHLKTANLLRFENVEDFVLYSVRKEIERKEYYMNRSSEKGERKGFWKKMRGMTIMKYSQKRNSFIVVAYLFFILSSIGMGGNVYRYNDTCTGLAEIEWIKIGGKYIYKNNNPNDHVYLMSGTPSNFEIRYKHTSDAEQMKLRLFRDVNGDKTFSSNEMIHNDFINSTAGIWLESKHSAVNDQAGERTYLVRLDKYHTWIDRGLLWNDYYYYYDCIKRLTIPTGYVFVVSSEKPGISLEVPSKFVTANIGDEVTINAVLKNLANDTNPTLPEQPLLDLVVECKIKETGDSCGKGVLEELLEGKTSPVSLSFTPKASGTLTLEIDVRGKYADGSDLFSDKELLSVTVKPECDKNTKWNCLDSPPDCPCPEGYKCDLNNPVSNSKGCYSPGRGDTICDIATECADLCEDCTNGQCIGNGHCDTIRGENCQTTSNDCECTAGMICFPSADNADTFGCTKPFCGDSECDEKKECRDACKDCTESDCRGNKQCDVSMGETCTLGGDCPCEEGQYCDPGKTSRMDERGCVRAECGKYGCEPPVESSKNCCLDCSCPNSNQWCDTRINLQGVCTEYQTLGGSCDDSIECASKLCCGGSCQDKSKGVCCTNVWYDDGCCNDADCVRIYNKDICYKNECWRIGECGNGICEIETECKLKTSCSDCSSQNCTEDGHCSEAYGETCETVPTDCICIGKIDLGQLNPTLVVDEQGRFEVIITNEGNSKAVFVIEASIEGIPLTEYRIEREIEKGESEMIIFLAKALYPGSYVIKVKSYPKLNPEVKREQSYPIHIRELTLAEKIQKHPYFEAMEANERVIALIAGIISAGFVFFQFLRMSRKKVKKVSDSYHGARFKEDAVKHIETPPEFPKEIKKEEWGDVQATDYTTQYIQQCRSLEMTDDQIKKSMIAQGYAQEIVDSYFNT